mmetsp:Transcript_20487/g.62479  ORF Transcript_20487/g.62479 Transcript_20487/m.62479 type:complete len:609 (-) Transcript_20487:572-2398(-)
MALSPFLLLPTLSYALLELSNTLGDGMVLQRAPYSALLWGFGSPGVAVVASFDGQSLPPETVASDGIWRIRLPPTEARSSPSNISFVSTDGSNVLLRDVLFGDVYLCSGQSNMQYTPRSVSGMNNMSAEIASADALSDQIRIFTVGQDTMCGDPDAGKTDCSQPFEKLNPRVPPPEGPCPGGRSCRKPWASASAATVGGNAWDDFSAICFLFGRRIHEAEGIPIGLISSNWGGTMVQAWSPLESLRECGSASTGGPLYNSMIAPFTIGPMALTGALWYQGESNVGQARYYSCQFPSMIRWWRTKLGAPNLWFGFIQIAGYAYSRPKERVGGGFEADVRRSHAAGDLRQAQLAALTLPNVAVSTAVDTGDYFNIHPPDKQTPAGRLANHALHHIYGHPIGNGAVPMYAGAKLLQLSNPRQDGGRLIAGSVAVCVKVRANGAPVKLSRRAPKAATQTSTRGKATSVARNRCVTDAFAFNATRRYGAFPEDCGYPAIGGHAPNGTWVWLNATAEIGIDGSSIILRADLSPSLFRRSEWKDGTSERSTKPQAQQGGASRSPPSAAITNATITQAKGFIPIATSYGRASWPMTTFFFCRWQIACLAMVGEYHH